MFLATYAGMSIRKKNFLTLRIVHIFTHISSQQPLIEHLIHANTEAHLPRRKRQRHDACGDAGATIARPAGAAVVDAVEQTDPPAPAAAASDVNVVVIVVVAEEESGGFLQELPT